MPIYEYKCKKCTGKFTQFFRGFSETQDPICSHCSSSEVFRIISKVSVIIGWNDGLSRLPSWETMTDFDEDTPASVARHLSRLKQEMGDGIGPEGEELTALMDQQNIRNEFDALDS